MDRSYQPELESSTMRSTDFDWGELDWGGLDCCGLGCCELLFPDIGWTSVFIVGLLSFKICVDLDACDALSAIVRFAAP